MGVGVLGRGFAQLQCEVDAITYNTLGGIVLGVGGDSSNNSWGTFEGAIVAGNPSAATDLAVFKNLKAVGHTK